jgi:hypothetical protein
VKLMVDNDSIEAEIQSIKVHIDEYSKVLKGIEIEIKKGNASVEAHGPKITTLVNLGKNIFNETNQLQAKILLPNSADHKFTTRIAAIGELLKSHIALQDTLTSHVKSNEKEYNLLKKQYEKLKIEVSKKSIRIIRKSLVGSGEVILLLTVAGGTDRTPIEKDEDYRILGFVKEGYDLLKEATSNAVRELLILNRLSFQTKQVAENYYESQ